MKFIDRQLKRLDNFQLSHRKTGFVFAVFKKYSDDSGSYQSALITYFGLLSLFPLLIILTAITEFVFRNNPELRTKVIHSVTGYFPILGSQLQGGLHSPQKTGVALIITLLIMLYGARGGANALQATISNLWRIPKTKRPSFIKGLSRTLGIIFMGGLGLILAPLISGYIVFSSSDTAAKLVSIVINLILIWLTLIIVFKLAIAGHKRTKDVVLGAGVATIFLFLLQIFGNLILAQQLKKLHNVYGIFALTVGLMLWLYLQAQALLYAVEIDVVKHYHLFPVSLFKRSEDK